VQTWEECQFLSDLRSRYSVRCWSRASKIGNQSVRVTRLMRIPLIVHDVMTGYENVRSHKEPCPKCCGTNRGGVNAWCRTRRVRPVSNDAKDTMPHISNNFLKCPFFS